MALSIKNESTDQLVRRYAKVRKTTCTKAVHLAVSDALRREGHTIDDDEEQRVAEFLDFVHTLQVDVAAAPTLDNRTPDDILYDADGLPH